MSGNTVLFVDDEINVLNSLRRGLMNQDYKCVFVQSGNEALKVLEKEEISVLVTDMRMPGMDGLSLLKIVKEKYPQTVRIVLSGYTQLQQILVTLNQADIFRYVTKPWKLEEEFIYVIRQSIDYYNLHRESNELKKALESRNVSYQNILKDMDEKISEGKKDIENLKSLWEQTFQNVQDVILKTIENSPSSERTEKILKLARQIYTGYLATIPAELVNFDLKKVVSDFEGGMKGINPKNKIMISSDHAKIQDFHDNYKLLAFILSSLGSMSLEKNQAVIIKVVMATESCEDSIRLEVYMEIQSIESELQNFDNFYDDVVLKLLNAFYNEICKVLKGNLLLDKKGDKLSIKIQGLLAKQV